MFPNALLSLLICLIFLGHLLCQYFLESLNSDREINQDSIGDDMPILKSIMDFFTTMDWLESSNNIYRFTDEGLFFIKRSTAYGVTVSYLPTFLQIPELLFGNPNVLW